MKNLISLLVLFAVILMANAQVNSLTHIVSGGFNRAGFRIANGFGKWNTATNRFVDLPTATFTGGSAVVSDIASAGNGFLVVGDFTAVNGVNANGIAYFDGTRWCSYPHLFLYSYVKPFPQDTRFPRAASVGAAAGTATAIYNIGNDYYVFGGVNGNTGRTRFNQVGSVFNGVAGLVRLRFDGTNNFTVDTTLVYETRGQTAGIFEPSTNGFPADPAYSAPTTTLGRTKLRVINAAGFLSFYVHPNVGTNSHISRWRAGDGNWLQITANTPTFTAFNVSGTSTQFSVTALALGAVVRDFDIDAAANVVFIAGGFDNTANTTASVQYLHVASSGNAHSTAITWGKAVNWANYNNFNNTGQFASAITVINQNSFFVAVPFQSRDANDALLGVNQFTIFSVTNNNPVAAGGRFANADGSDPNISKLAYYNTKVYAYGTFGLIDYVVDQANLWPRRYTRRISNAVQFDGTNWVNAYGGYTTVTTNLPGYAATSGFDYVWYQGATSFYDIYSAGKIVAYNKKTFNWVNLAPQRFTVRGNGNSGSDGVVNAVHFIKKSGTTFKDKVLVAGTFDWYGTQYLGSVAYLNTASNTFEQVGQGVYVEESTNTYSADQTTALYRAGSVWDIEEVNDKFYVGGVFTKNIAGKCLGNLASVSVNGGTFEAVGNGCDGTVWDLLANGDNLYVGGEFSSCSGIQGTRRIAAYNTKKNTFSALSAGLPNGKVFAMIWWSGKLLVGGSFTTAPGGLINGANGLFTWDGNRWGLLPTKCFTGCDGTDLTFPFSSGNPVVRSVNNVKSLRKIGGNLYIQGGIQTTTGDFLIQYDGSRFRKYGDSTGGACQKQGCLASNNSFIIGGGYNRPETIYNQNFEQYNPNYRNWIETYTGFDAAPIIVASANLISLSIFSLIFVVLLAL